MPCCRRGTISSSMNAIFLSWANFSVIRGKMGHRGEGIGNRELAFLPTRHSPLPNTIQQTFTQHPASISLNHLIRDNPVGGDRTVYRCELPSDHVAIAPITHYNLALKK